MIFSLQLIQFYHCILLLGKTYMNVQKMKSGRTNIISYIVNPSVRIRLGNTYGRRQKSQGSEEVSKFSAIRVFRTDDFLISQ